MKIMKKIYFMLPAICICVSLLPLPAFAASSDRLRSSVLGQANGIRIQKATYEGDVSGYYGVSSRKRLSEIEVDFLQDVEWSYSAKIVSVKDNKGKKYSGYLMDTDEDGCDIAIAGMNHGRTYTIVVDGIRRSRSFASFHRLSIRAKLPALPKSSGNIRVARVSADDSYGEVDVKFAGKVLWNYNARVVSVKDDKGKNYRGFLADMDDDDCEIYIENMNYGRTYSIKISGIKMWGMPAFETAVITAKVPARKNALTVKQVEYEEDYERGGMEYKVKIEFDKRIERGNGSSVIIRDASGKAYSSASSFVEWDDDECEVYLSGPLSFGSTYTYEISGVKTAGSGSFSVVKGSFTAW